MTTIRRKDSNGRGTIKGIHPPPCAVVTLLPSVRKIVRKKSVSTMLLSDDHGFYIIEAKVKLLTYII